VGRACLSLGSNLEPETNLVAAAAALRARFDSVRFSPVYRVPAEGFDGPDFLNAGAVLESDLDPIALDAWLHALEDAQGRRRDVPRFSSRTLDLDLVLYDDRVLRGPGHLVLPRPDLRHAFVLKPLTDVAPETIEPVSGASLHALWQAHPERDRGLSRTDLVL
jgi:2-amino-4-hydroxy-6-hydroxymethyldihydropteridine diphosphokinase